MPVATGRSRRPPLLSPATLAPLGWWTRRQWVTAAGAGVGFLVTGEIGQRLPPNSIGRLYPMLWWSWATLVAMAVLLGLVAALFVGAGWRRFGGAGRGVAALVAAVAMACPVPAGARR